MYEWLEFVCHVVYSGHGWTNLPREGENVRMGNVSLLMVWAQRSKSEFVGCSFGNLIPVWQCLARVESMAAGLTVDPSHVSICERKRLGTISMLC